MLTDEQRFAAANSLIDWCESQDLKPADAAAVFTTVLAISITSTQSDAAILYKSADVLKKLYLLDISEQLRIKAQ